MKILIWLNDLILGQEVPALFIGDLRIINKALVFWAVEFYLKITNAIRCIESASGDQICSWEDLFLSSL